MVLAGCDTAVGAIRKGEGVESLERAFLAAGVPAVMATLWKIEDSAAAVFLSEFYRALNSAGDPVAALRQAQVHCIRDARSKAHRPRVWAAFQMAGGTS